jgi:hypothetical protein
MEEKNLNRQAPRTPSFKMGILFFPCLPWRLGGPILFFDMKNFSPPSRQERQVFRARENLSSLFLGGLAVQSSSLI